MLFMTNGLHSKAVEDIFQEKGDGGRGGATIVA
jgi:hypothetical protein